MQLSNIQWTSVHEQCLVIEGLRGNCQGWGIAALANSSIYSPDLSHNPAWGE